MKILASSSNIYYLRIVDDANEDLIKSYLDGKSSYIASYNPFIEISGPDSECDDLMDFLYDHNLRFRVW